jgi:hypothetical protein
MPITPIHSEIKKAAGPNPAAYMSIDLVQALTIERFLFSIQKLKGTELSAGQGLLSASLADATFAKPPKGSARLVKYKTASDNQIGLALNSDLTVVVNVFVKGDKSKSISTVTLVVADLMVLGSYANNAVSFEGIDCKPPKATVVRDALADKILHDAKIDPLEAARVEGLIAYSAVNSSIKASLAQRKEIALGQVFPAFDFGPAAKLIPLQSGEFLGIVPAAFTKVEAAACKCAAGPDLQVSQSSNTITVPPNPKPGTQLGGVTIGGPLPEKIDPLKDLGRRHVGSGLAGVYLPRAAYTGLTVQTMPAIDIHASDDGFIGFDAHATVGFPLSKVGVSLDGSKGGIIVTVGLDIAVQATCTLDIGCGIRLPIGYALINSTPGSNPRIVMGFYPAVDQSGNVKLRAVLQDADMGQYVAVIVGIGAALEIIGVTAWIGFLIDVVLSAIVSYELPFALRDEVKKYLGQNEWTLLSLGQLLRNSYGPAGKFAAPFDVDTGTILASVAIDKELGPRENN